MKKEKKKTSIISKRRKYKIINTFSSKYKKKKKKKTCMSEMTYIYIYICSKYILPFLGNQICFCFTFHTNSYVNIEK
jgi:hypothetical protein